MRKNADKSDMGRIDRKPQLLALLLSSAFVLSACMPKIEEADIPANATLTADKTTGAAPAEMKITLTGTCPPSSVRLRVLVAGTEYNVDQSTSSLVANSGIPIGTCKNGILTINYPVPNPTVSRTITFKVKARLNDGRSSVTWATRDVRYYAPNVGPGLPIAVGYRFSNAGGNVVTASHKLRYRIGKPEKVSTHSTATHKLRTGKAAAVQGVTF